MGKSIVLDSKRAYGVAEIAQSYGISIGYLRNEIKAHRLPIKRFGRRVLVLKEDWEKYLEDHDTGPAEGFRRAREEKNRARLLPAK
jgi:excisionase family DNA binding protein